MSKEFVESSMPSSRSAIPLNANPQLTIEKLKSSVDEANGLVANYQQLISKVQNEKKALEAEVENAGARLVEARRDEAIAKEKLEKTISLQKGQYAGLIAELFEVPKQNLENSIRKQSASSNRITIFVAILSIVLSLAASGYFQWQGSRDARNVTDRLESSARSLEASVASSIEAMQLVRSESEIIRTLVEKIRENASDFSGYQAKNDLAQAYVVRLGPSCPSAYYESWLESFRVAGINVESIPDSAAEIEKWTDFGVRLYDNWTAEAEKYFSIVGTQQSFRTWNNFKINTDPIRYSVYYTGPMTIGDLKSRLRIQRDGLKKQQLFNNFAQRKSGENEIVNIKHKKS